MAGVQNESKRFRIVTITASVVSALLWISAGSVAVNTSDFYSYTIIGILAGVASMIGVNSAKKEGFKKGEAAAILRQAQRE